MATGFGAMPWWVGISDAFNAVVGGGRRGGGCGNTNNHNNRSNNLKEKKRKSLLSFRRFSYKRTPSWVAALLLHGGRGAGLWWPAILVCAP